MKKTELETKYYICMNLNNPMNYTEIFILIHLWGL